MVRCVGLVHVRHVDVDREVECGVRRPWGPVAARPGAIHQPAIAVCGGEENCDCAGTRAGRAPESPGMRGAEEARS